MGRNITIQSTQTVQRLTVQRSQNHMVVEVIKAPQGSQAIRCYSQKSEMYMYAVSNKKNKAPVCFR